MVKLSKSKLIINTKLKLINNINLLQCNIYSISIFILDGFFVQNEEMQRQFLCFWINIKIGLIKYYVYILRGGEMIKIIYVNMNGPIKQVSQ